MPKCGLFSAQVKKQPKITAEGMLSLRNKTGHDKILPTNTISTITINLCIEDPPCEQAHA